MVWGCMWEYEMLSTPRVGGSPCTRHLLDSDCRSGHLQEGCYATQIWHKSSIAEKGMLVWKKVFAGGLAWLGRLGRRTWQLIRWRRKLLFKLTLANFSHINLPRLLEVTCPALVRINLTCVFSPLLVGRCCRLSCSSALSVFQLILISRVHPIHIF
jgi:hypothetical protein